MVQQLPGDARRVVELGAGTGVFTRALLDHGVAADELLVLELNAELHRFLAQRFPGLGIVHGDACDLSRIVADRSFAGAGEIDAVVSGLGLLAMPRELQRRILQAAFAVLGADRPLIQFTYAPINPLPQALLRELGLRARRAAIAWRNVPPASVYVYTRNPAESSGPPQPIGASGNPPGARSGS